jgi:hypothetical protein
MKPCASKLPIAPARLRLAVRPCVEALIPVLAGCARVGLIAVFGAWLLAASAFSLPMAQASTQADPWSFVGGLRQGCVRGTSALPVLDAAALPDGRIVVVGDFPGCGGVVSAGVAIYRPSTNDWEALPANPVGGTISRVATGGGAIYVAGSFTSINGVPARRLARWSGGTWEEFAGGVNGTVQDILVLGSDVYITGVFTEAGGVSVNAIARHDGTQWQPLGAGASNGLRFNTSNGQGNALLAVGADVYVGGIFTQAGGVAAASIARWSGGSFTPLGSGVGGGAQIFSLDAAGGQIYAAGDYTSIGGITANRIAVWNGATWSRLGSETANGTNAVINSVAVLNGTVYVAGFFNTTAGLPIARLARFAGGTWSALPVTPNGFNLYAIALGPRLYVIGNLTAAGTLPLSYIGQFDGSTWSGLGQGSGAGFNGEVRAVLAQGTDIYVGGRFTEVNGVQVNRIARWDGSQWHALATPTKNGVDDWVETLAWYQGSLYVGGYFGNFVNTVNTDFQLGGLARWDGSEWHFVGPFRANYVLALREWNGDLYIGGSFASFWNGLDANNVVRWNGSTFARMPDVLQANGVNGYVTTLEVYNGELIVAGNFTSAAMVGRPRVARWNGSTWNGLGSGVDGLVNATAIYNNDLIVAGAFNNAGGAPASRIARWNGSTWAPLASSIDLPITDLAVRGSELVVAGFQTTINGQPNRQLSVWNGASWAPLVAPADLPNGLTRTVQMVNGRLWVGGPFAGVGTQASAGLLIEAGANADIVFASGFE